MASNDNLYPESDTIPDDSQDASHFAEDMDYWSREDLDRLKSYFPNLTLGYGELRVAPYTDLRGLDLSGIVAPGAVFTGVNLSRAKLEGAYLVEARFSQATLEETNFKNAQLSRAHFEGEIHEPTNLWRTNLSGATCQAANFTSTNLREAILENADCSQARFCDSDLSCLSGTKLCLRAACFSHEVNLSHAVLKNSIWNEAHIESRFLYEQADFTNADFTGVVGTDPLFMRDLLDYVGRQTERAGMLSPHGTLLFLHTGTVLHPITRLYQPFFCINGTDFRWIGAYNDWQKAQDDIRILTKAQAGGYLADAEFEFLEQLLDSLGRLACEEASDIPEPMFSNLKRSCYVRYLDYKRALKVGDYEQAKRITTGNYW